MSNQNKTKLPMRKYFLIDEKTPFEVREAYKSARTNLLSVLSVAEGGCKQICFTSPEVADGKTLNCANLALSFAQMGSKILIIDADMRKPKMHKVFKVLSTPGLSDCLSGFCDLEKAIVHSNVVEGLDVLPAGKIPPNPTELILSNNFNKLLASTEDKYDYVFIDAPPAGIVTDATIISKKTKGAILVCRSGATRAEMANKAKNEIEQGGGRVLASLLNCVTSEKNKKKSKKSYSGYYYYDEDDGEEEVEK